MAKKTARPPAIIVPPESELGPAMKELTIPQRAFVLAFADFGGTNQAEAARIAGYGSTPESCQARAAAMVRQPRILAALREEADKRLRGGAILAASVLCEIAGDKFSKDRYKAAVELLNRAGLVVEGVSRVIVEDHRTAEEIERRVSDLAVKLGIDPARLLGTVVEDVDYEEVDVETRVENVREEMDAWQKEQRDFDAFMERSKPDEEGE